MSEYYRQTTPIAAQLVYGITMLGRWAKFTAPIRLNVPGTPMPHDTSANDPNVNLFRNDSEYAASVASTRPTPPESSPSTRGRDPQEYSQIVLREGTDPRLPLAVAELRKQIQNQPGLTLDVSGILTDICSRFEEANATFQVGGMEPGALDHTVWSMSAVKVRITRAKLERWAEIVAARTEALQIGDDNEDIVHDAAMDDSEEADTGTSSMASSEPIFNDGGLPAEPMQAATNNWNTSMPWTSDMLQGVDPSLWFDGDLDWGAVIMNSMGNLEQ